MSDSSQQTKGLAVIGIILLAAGSASRFRAAGGQGNKLNASLPGNASSIFAMTLQQALNSGLPVHVVTRPDNPQVQAECAEAGVTTTLIDSAGSGDSIAAGVKATPHWSGWLVHLADMPFVPAALFLRVSQALQKTCTARPYWQEQPGHPVGFSSMLRDELMALRGDAGARELLERYPALAIAADGPATFVDIDLPTQLGGAL